MKLHLIAATILVLGSTVPGMADTIEGPPPEEGSSCTGTCTAPGGEGGQWDEGPSSTDTSTDTYVESSSTTYNQAEIASGGKASDKNQSNFRETTTTSTVVTTTTTNGSWVNHGGNNPPPKTFVEKTVVYDSQSTETTKSHVKPTKP